MSKVEILYFAADPLSVTRDGIAPPLQLGQEVRKIRHRVRAAKHRHALRFDVHLATRTEDLIQAFSEARPQVVHFSGHGGANGLKFEGPDGGGPQSVSADALAQLFTTFRGDIRLVVLNACYSEPQARAIADAVGCAIGTCGPISDTAAITFASTFYSGIAFGESVQTAWERAATALALDGIPEKECPKILTGKGVYAKQLVLVPDAQEPGPEPMPRWEGILISLVGALSLLGAMVLDVSFGPALALSLVPVLITAGLMRYARSPVARGAMRPARTALSAVMLSAAAMLGGTSVVKSIGGEQETAPQGIQLAVCTQEGTARPLGLLTPAGVSRTPGGESGVEGELAEAKADYEAGNYDAAFLSFQRAADAGSAEAMGYVGTSHLCGEGTERQPDLARLWLLRAAQEGDARAMYALGVAHEARQIFQNPTLSRARNWYRKSASLGYVDAMRSLGRLHRADGAADSALVWYDKAAGAGSVEALVDAGRIYEEGRLAGGTNLDSARVRYHKAAEQGSARARFEMGRIYQEGVGVRRDYAVAIVWYKRAATVGSADAMNQLGILHQKGLGVPPSSDEALRWYRQAADLGSAEARRNLAALESGWWGWMRRSF
ncbi:MAG TPA: CHAT domain-containing protein [Longimicrobium sp.]|nr:CHAT domain-containing protein [Longimicrobium sp.]